MYSNLVPFQNVIDAIKDETGGSNLRNLYPHIRRLLHRAQSEIGYGGSLIMKRIKYSTSDGTISDGRVRLPEDFIAPESIGMCQEGICPGDYKKQGNFLFFCKPVESFNFIYYALLCDGEGNPVVTENHFEAVVAGIKFFLYAPKLWNNEGNMNFYKHLEKYYEDRVAEARGNDVFPNSKAEWAQISQKLKMSYRDMLIYSSEENCYCCIPVCSNNTNNTENTIIVYDWQYDNLQDNSSLAPTITQAFLDLQNSEELNIYLSGRIVDYNKVGRIGFAIQGIVENQYKILDIFNIDITSLVFDTYYNTDLKTQIYISKEYYSHGNILFKLI